MTAVFVYDEQLARISLGPDHPFKPSRAVRMREICEQVGFLGTPQTRIVTPLAPDPEAAVTVHDPAYLDALQRAGEAFHEDLLRFNLGRAECPVFPGVYDYALGCVAATLAGLRALEQDGAPCAFNPVGGMHHAMPGHAEGFCYLNDAAIALRRWMGGGRRLAYVDLDAHHGNGVQRVFYDTDQVLTISLHESGRTLYPFGGFEDEIGEGAGRGYNVNFPLPEETDDELYNAVFEAVVMPLLEAYRPDGIVLVIGVDTLAQDPLAHLSLTNNAVERCLRRLVRPRVPVLALGGGGYTMDAAARAWALGWAALGGLEVGEVLPGLGGRFLGNPEIGGAGLRDMHVVVAGETRRRNVVECTRVEAALKRQVFPIVGAPS